MPEVRKKLWEMGYILILMGGGITGFIQINDTHLHRSLKGNYCEEETALMLGKLMADRTKVPISSRDNMIKMLVTAWDKIEIDFGVHLKTVL